jgi:hypothetical protein
MLSFPAFSLAARKRPFVSVRDRGAHLDELGPFIVLFIDHVEIVGIDIAGEPAGELEEVGVEADGDFHAFVVVIHNGGKEGSLAELADLHDFRQVLVVLGKAILPRERGGRCLRPLRTG